MCWKCKKNTVEASSITRNSECPVCHSDLHSCLNCKFYDQGSHYDCHETIDELVKDKEKRNFCDYFSAKIYSDSRDQAGLDKAAQAKNKFASLFGDL
ncbi:MAG: hypothetical protein K5839_04090 [Treponemataceae bacterium]|nr:hypothetical protein [Treponemataceae bacterium]